MCWTEGLPGAGGPRSKWRTLSTGKVVMVVAGGLGAPSGPLQCATWQLASLGQVIWEGEKEEEKEGREAQTKENSGASPGIQWLRVLLLGRFNPWSGN